MTPDYPLKYPSGLDCACSLTSAGGQGWIGLTTFEFLLPKTNPCTDWLFVTADNSNDKFCGSSDKTYRAKSLSFVFHSERESFKGFMLYFEGECATICHALSRKCDLIKLFIMSYLIKPFIEIFIYF